MTTEEFEKFVRDAKEDSNVLGLILQGSRGKGFSHEHSDYDLYLIVKDGTEEHCESTYKKPHPRDDISVESLTDFENYATWGSNAMWDRYDFAHVEILVDRLGTLRELTEEKGKIPLEKLKEFISWAIDGYVNSVFRFVKIVRNGDLFGVHLTATNSVLDLLTLVYALEGRHRPFLDYVGKELKIYPLKELPWDNTRFMQMIKKVLESADLKTQQEFLIEMEKVCRAKGYGNVFDEWKGKDKWAMTFKP
jgi:hypothetical protein